MEQKDILEAGALAIENIVVLEQAKSLLDNEIEPALFVAIDQAVKSQLAASWEADLTDSTEKIVDVSWFAKQTWKAEDDTYFAQFIVWAVGDDNKDNSEWWITSLLGLADTEAGFEWALKWSQIGMEKKIWKQKSSEFFNKSSLRELGFKYKDKNGTFFLPMQVNQAELVQAWKKEEKEDDVGSLLASMIEERMEIIFKAADLFDQLIKEVKQ